MVVAGALALALLPAVPSRGSPAPATLDAFFHYDRPAIYSSLRLDVRVPMRDGVHLGCYLYVPAEQGTSTPAPGRFPAIVGNFTPYYIAYPFGAFGAAYFAERGYLDIECTPRGTGTSEGTFGGWFSEVEANDNYDLIEWLAARADSTGKVAQEGNSYGGMTAYRVAALHPPSLVTIAPQQAYSSLYDNYTYPGGIRSLGDPYWYGFAGGVGVVRPMLSAQEASWAAHPLLDDYWRQIDIDTKWGDIDIPVLAYGGWVDIFQDGMAKNYIGLRGKDSYLIDGPWTHGSTFDDTVTRGTLLAWFDRWLAGDTSAPLPPTPVSSYRMPGGPWQSLAGWPPPGSYRRSFALTTDGNLSPSRGEPGERVYAVNPGAGAADLPSGDHLDFTGEPLAEDFTIAGAGRLRLLATLDDPSGAAALQPDLVDTNFVVHVYDVAPDGTEALVTRGYLKASHRSSHAARERIPLGSPVLYTVPLWHVHHRVVAGHHLRVRLQTGEQDCCLSAAPALAQPLLPLRVTVATGSRGSVLSLPELVPAGGAP